MDELRIALATDAPRFGGAERYLAEIAAAAVGAGHSVEILAPQREVLEAIGSVAAGAQLVRIGDDAYSRTGRPAARAVALARTAPSVFTALLRRRTDVLHVNNGGYPGSDLLRVMGMLAPSARIPRRVMSVHSVPWERESLIGVQSLADRILWRSLDAVLGATDVVGERLRELRHMPGSLFRKIPYGVDEPSGREEAAALRAQLAPGGELLVGMISGSADPGKGHAVLLEAAARARPPLAVVVVGAHPPAQAMSHAGDTEAAARVHVAGAVPDVGPYLHAIDVLVVPSVAFESLPLVVLEAMAAGRPIIASRIAGIPEAVEDGVTGYLFEPGNVERLAALLGVAADDRDALHALGTRAHGRWRERFSLPAMTGAMLSLYAELGGGARRRRYAGVR